MNEQPPLWADALLRTVLSPDARESVSGDLIEEYRDSIFPASGRRAADRWYVRQVGGYLWRSTRWWALAFGGAFMARTWLDALVPTTDFSIRSFVSTACGTALLASGAWWASWRCRSIVAGVIAAVTTSVLAAVFSVAGNSLLLALRHDPATMRAIAGSGGLAEAYTLPFMMLIPAVFLGMIGGAAGRVTRLNLVLNFGTRLFCAA